MPKRNLDHAEPYDSPLYSPQVKTAYNGNGDLEYLGLGTPKAKLSEPFWVIKKFLYVNGNFDRKVFANGNNTQNFIWDDRATYDYTPDDE